MLTWTELLLFSEKLHGLPNMKGWVQQERQAMTITTEGQFAISPSGESSTRHALLQHCCLRYQSVSHISRQKALEFTSTRR